MTRGRRETVELPAAEAAELPAEVAGDDERGPGLSLFDASGDARVRLLRRDDKTQKWIPHGYLPVEATEETVLKLFGGGYYWSQLLVQTDVGREGIKQSRRFTLTAPYKPPLHGIPGIDYAVDKDGKQIPNSVSPNGSSASSPVTVSSIPASGDLMEVLKAGIINTLLELMKTTKDTHAPQTDPMLLEMVRQQGAVQTKIIELMLAQSSAPKGDNGNSKKDILEMLATMKELVTPPVVNGVPTDPMQMFNSMLDTFKSFREAAEDVAPQPTNYDPMSAIPKLVEVVAEEHQMRKNAAAMTHVPTPAPHGGIAHMPQVGTIEIPMWRRILQQQGARLLTQAAAKSDPDVIAGASILFAPPAVREALLGFFKRDENEVMADILTEIPQLAEYREWLAEFVECAQVRLFPEEFADEGNEPEKTDDTTGR